MKFAVFSSLVLWTTLVAGAEQASDWPQFRGPTGQGISTASDVPLEWSATQNVAWKTQLPGSGWSSPVLSGGRVYLTCAVRSAEGQKEHDADSESGGVSLRAICLESANGRIVWDVEAIHAAADDAKKVHPKNGLASPTPVVSGDRLYVHFGHMGTAALDLDGHVVWRQTSIKYSPVHGNGGSPVVVDDLLVFNCDGSEDPFVVALDRTTGMERWRTARRTDAQNKFSFSTPLVVDVNGAKQLISPASGFAAGYDTRSGRELWRVRYGDGYSVIPRPVVKEGLLFISSGFNRPVLHAIRLPNPSNGDEKGDLTDTNVVWRENKGAPLTPSPVAAGDALYTVSDDGVAACLDVDTGKVRWTHRLGGAFSASPVFAEGRIYFLNEEGVCYVVAADTDFKLLATNKLDERTFASPAVADGAVYLRSESHLWRIGGRAAR